MHGSNSLTATVTERHALVHSLLHESNLAPDDVAKSIISFQTKHLKNLTIHHMYHFSLAYFHMYFLFLPFLPVANRRCFACQLGVAALIGDKKCPTSKEPRTSSCPCDGRGE